jgi:hypothetical protein
MLQKFREEFTLINRTQEIKSDCNSLNIINIGTATAIINGVSLLPGEQYYVQGNENEFNETRYIISFTGAGTEEVKLIRKIYN